MTSLVLLQGCSERQPHSQADFEETDVLFEKLLAEATAFEPIASIDHARLAAETGEVMPPARVMLFSDSEINTRILQLNPVAGLDLPFRVLAYSDRGEATVAYTTSDFIKRRHSIDDAPALAAFDHALQAVLEPVPEASRRPVDASAVSQGYGMSSLDSNYPFEETIERLKTTILAEGDTIWFGELDYRAQAGRLGVELPRLTLLLFGAPGPGGKAMADYPRMGLDAFCQKLLVQELPDGSVRIHFNQMPAFAELHNNDKALPHMVINYRMGGTLGGAIE